MKIIVTGRQTHVPAEFAQIAEKKLEKLNKYFKDDAQATVKLKNERDKDKVEVTLTAGGNMFRSEEVDETYQNALDKAIDTLVRQIRKNKTKLEKRLRDASKTELFAETIDYEEEGVFDIRTKSFSVKPMTPEEAILQMNITGHDFYMFRDDRTDEICVVYKRRDKGYGLIIPQK